MCTEKSSSRQPKRCYRYYRNRSLKPKGFRVIQCRKKNESHSRMQWEIKQYLRWQCHMENEVIRKQQYRKCHNCFTIAIRRMKKWKWAKQNRYRYWNIGRKMFWFLKYPLDNSCGDCERRILKHMLIFGQEGHDNYLN